MTPAAVVALVLLALVALRRMPSPRVPTKPTSRGVSGTGWNLSIPGFGTARGTAGGWNLHVAPGQGMPTLDWQTAPAGFPAPVGAPGDAGGVPAPEQDPLGAQYMPPPDALPDTLPDTLDPSGAFPGDPNAIDPLPAVMQPTPWWIAPDPSVIDTVDPTTVFGA